MSNYTVEDFKKWLKADIKGWWWILKQIKSDADLRASLINSNDQGSWNFSDPQWRKKRQWFGESFDDYYQVFLKYKEEVDSQTSEGEEKNNSNDSSTSNPVNNNDKPESEEPEKNDIPPLTISEQIIALFTYWKEMNISNQAGFNDQVTKMLILLKSEANADYKMKSLENFLSKYGKGDTELRELVKEWKEEEKIIEESVETPLSDTKNWPWGKIGIGVVVVLLVGAIWWGGKKVISFF